MTTTIDLTKFGYRELKMLEQLLKAMREQGLPDGFDNDEVTPMMNMNSGNVFLTNSNYDAAKMNGDTLEKWFNCPYCGHEGFLEDMQHDAIDDECKEYMNEIGVK